MIFSRQIRCSSLCDTDGYRCGIPIRAHTMETRCVTGFHTSARIFLLLVLTVAFSLLLSFFGFFSLGFVSTAFENIPRRYIQLHLITPRNDIESCRWKNNYPDIKLIVTNVTEGFSQKIQSGRRKILRRFPSPEKRCIVTQLTKSRRIRWRRGVREGPIAGLKRGYIRKLGGRRGELAALL